METRVLLKTLRHNGMHLLTRGEVRYEISLSVSSLKLKKLRAFAENVVSNFIAQIPRFSARNELRYTPLPDQYLSQLSHVVHAKSKY